MPLQAAPQSGQAPAVNSPPLLPIPPYRERLFTLGVGERLRVGAAKGESEAQTLATISAERTALAAAIESETFREAFARAYEVEHNALMPQAPVSDAQARHATDDIIKNRANDAGQLAQLITQPDFMERARTAPAKPANYALPPEKITEMVARFTAEGSSYGIDARIHNQQAMEGHRVGHLALVKAFAENGPLHAPLVQALKAQLPAMDDVAVSALANDWLEARRDPAHATAEELREGGTVYDQVVNRSDSTRIAATQAQADALHRRAPLALGAAALMGSTALSPAEFERRKTPEQRAQDVAYTINHALSCGITDSFIQIPVSEWVAQQGQKEGTFTNIFRFVDRFFEKHDHDHSGHDCAHHSHEDHHHAKPKPTPKPHVHENGLMHWLKGEVVGDVGAVPLTIMVQRNFPGFMHGLRTMLEPIAGWAFRGGAQRDARHWAKHNNFAADGPEAKAKEQSLYEHEISHLPQAVVWNVFSIPINLFTQKKILKSSYTWGELIVGKTFGSLFSNGVLLGARAVAPESMHKWDTVNSDYVIKPTGRVVGSILGVDKKTMDDAADKHTQLTQSSWQGRLAATPLEAERNI